MTTTLFTFLGRVPKKEGRYRTTRYDFGDGELTDPVAFFGWPLTQRLSPDRLVIFGTTGSMWDHLFEVDQDLGSQLEKERLELIKTTARKSVCRKHLERMEPLLEARLECEVKLDLIPYCRNESEQVEVLRRFSCHVAERDSVHLDITHGFRTLPMLGVLAALYLRRVRRAEIAGIWYGFFDPDTQEAPVQDLMGVLHIADWLEALAIYDRDGDYGAFKDLVGPAGELLQRAAFFERTSNPVEAREALTAWACRTDRFPEGDAAADLFGEELEGRVAWHDGPHRAAWEQDLAHIYLEKGDYLRAVIYGMEAVITGEALRRCADGQNFGERIRLRNKLREDNEEFEKLAYLRNALAHGPRSETRQVASAMTDETRLRESIGNLFEILF